MKRLVFRILAVAAICSIAQANSIVVNTTTDVSYPPGSGLISLRNAIATANSSTSPTTITFDPTAFASRMTIGLAGNLELTNTDYSTTITAPAAGLTIAAAPTDTWTVPAAAIIIDSGVTATLVGLVFTNTGPGYIDGASIMNSGTMTLSNIIISGPYDYDYDGIINSGAATLVNVRISFAARNGIFNYGGTAVLTNVTISGCSGSGIFNEDYGQIAMHEVNVVSNSYGGIYNVSTMVLNNCTVSDNSDNESDTYYAVGGIKNLNGASLTLTDVTVLNNTTMGTVGGGIRNEGTLNLTDSTVAGNKISADYGYGGGVYNSGGTATLINVTISGNTAPGDSGTSICGGGGIYNDTGGTITLTNVTVSGNKVPGGLGSGSGGGGIANVAPAGNFTIANSIIAGNTTDNIGPDVYGNFNSLGYNLIGKTDNGSGWNGTDRTGTKASPLNTNLAALANYGGPTQTMPPLYGSPAIDAGSNALIPSGVTTDQRGLPRKVNGTVDIGACEYQPGAVVTPVLNVSSVTPSALQVLNAGQSVTYTVTVQDGSGNPVIGATVNISDDVQGTCPSPLPTTNSSGQATYTTTVPSGTASGLYNISFTASKSGYTDSSSVTRQVQVQPYDYRAKFLQTASWLATQQKTSGSDFGGIQEAENNTAVETDNTQEAIWVWCRYAELTGDYTTYLTNINNAWTYCNANPAWLEGDTPTNYYTTYNVGWGMQAEMKYRQIYGGRPEYVDHTSYGQTCAQTLVDNTPGTSTTNDALALGRAVGSLYQYGVNVNNATYCARAVTLGNNVRTWLNSNTSNFASNGGWALSAGVAVWGVLNSYYKDPANSSGAAAWAATADKYMPDKADATDAYQNGHNGWYAWGYYAVSEYLVSGSFAKYQNLIDILLSEDADNDGGIPQQGSGTTNDFAWTTAVMQVAANYGLIAPTPSHQGVDYSDSHPNPSSLKAAGYSFAVRYVGGSGAPHDITFSEAQALQLADVNVIIVFEHESISSPDTSRMQGGYVNGVADAHTAVTDATAAGAPQNFFCYFACDFDAQPSDQTAINAYLEGAASVLGGVNRIGFYGGYWPLKNVLDAGKATKGWQTKAWSGDNKDSRISLFQHAGEVIKYDGKYDIDDGYGNDLGQWSVPTVRAFMVTPLSVVVGTPVWNAFTISYTVSDTGGSGLNRVELLRAPDVGGAPGTWQQVGSPTTLSGDGPVQGSFCDIPPLPVPGIWWYGIDVYDNAGNSNDEQNSETGGVPSDFGPNGRVTVTLPTAPTGLLQVTKCTVTAGSKDSSDAISFSGTMDATADEILAASSIEVTINSDNIVNPCVQTFPVNVTTFKKGKFSSTITNKPSKTSFTLDTSKKTFSFSASNVDLTGLSCPLNIEIKIGDFIGTTNVGEDIVNSGKPIPINLIMGVENSLRVDKSKFTRNKKTGNITQVAISGGFSVKDTIDMATNSFTVNIGTQTFTVPIGKFKNTKGKFTCSKVALSGGEIAAATFDFNKCTFTLTIKKTNFAASAGDKVFGIAFASFSESDVVKLP